MTDYKKLFFPQPNNDLPAFVPVILIFVLVFLFLQGVLQTYGILAPEVDKKSAIEHINKYRNDLNNFPGKPIITLSRFEDGNVEDRLTVRVLDGRGRKYDPYISMASILILSLVFSAWVSSIVIYHVSPTQGERAINILAYIVMIGCTLGVLYQFGIELIIKRVIGVS